jgi:hypothetical protein
MRLVVSLVLCAAAVIPTGISRAAEVEWFPSVAEMVGGPLPAADLKLFNPRVRREILDRFDFMTELHKDAQARVRSKLFERSGIACQGAQLTVRDMIQKVFVQGKFDDAVSKLVTASNLERRALEYLMYQPRIDETTYEDLKSVPVNALTRQWVERWLMDTYLLSAATQTAMTRMADHIWASECAKPQE